MLTLDFNVPERYNEARRIISGNYVFINYDKLQVYLQNSYEIMENLRREFNSLLSDIVRYEVWVNPGSPKQVLPVFIDILNIPSKYLNRYGRLSVSKEIVGRLPEKYKTPLVLTYLDFLEHQAYYTVLKQYEGVRPLENIYNNEGDRLTVVIPRYEIRDTYRFNTNSPNIQGLTKALSDIITAPEGYMVLSVDSAQIEPKIVASEILKDPLLYWLIDQHHDVYYALMDFCLRPSIDYNTRNLYKMTDLDYSFRDTLKTIVNAGVYGSSESALVNTVGETLGSAYYRRIVNHPNRLEHLRKIEGEIAKGNRTIKSYFGDERETYGSYNELKNRFINNPIQMSVSRLSAYSIFETQKYITENNLTNDIKYMLHRHDEDVLIISEKAFHEAENIAKFRAYKVGNWVPIYSEYKLGVNYRK